MKNPVWGSSDKVIQDPHKKDCSMNKLKIFILIIIIIAVSYNFCTGSLIDASQYTLSIPVGARAKGMGDTGITAKDYVYSPFWNPAGLGTVTATRYSLSYQSLWEDTMIASAGIGMPFNQHALGLYTAWFNAGEFELLSANGDTLDSSRTIQQDILIMLSYAYKIGSGLSAGINGKYLNSTLAEESKGTCFAGDVGLLWDFPDDKIIIGCSLQNIGKGIVYENQENPLPLSLKIGLTYFLVQEWDAIEDTIPSYVDSVALYIDTDKLLVKPYSKDVLEGINYNFGLEIDFTLPFFIRAGYKIQPEFNSYTLGGGVLFSIKAKQRMQLDYGFAYNGVFNNQHVISLESQF